MKGTHRLTVRYRPFEPQLSTKGTGLPVPQKRDDGRLQPLRSLRYVFRDAESKNVPQALKRSFVRPCAARVNPCPSWRAAPLTDSSGQPLGGTAKNPHCLCTRSIS
jgi:hypothetical protein